MGEWEYMNRARGPFQATKHEYKAGNTYSVFNSGNHSRSTWLLSGRVLIPTNSVPPMVVWGANLMGGVRPLLVKPHIEPVESAVFLRDNIKRTTMSGISLSQAVSV